MADLADARFMVWFCERNGMPRQAASWQRRVAEITKKLKEQSNG